MSQVVYQLRDHLFIKKCKGLAVSEKIGYADEQIFKEKIDFGRCFLEISHIRFQPVQLVDGYAPLNSAANGCLLVF